MKKYDVGVYGPPQEVPELDAFVDAYLRLCEMHGVMLVVEENNESRDSIQINEYDGECARDIFYSLDFNGSEAPFMRAAMLKSRVERDAAWKLKRENEAAAAEALRTEHEAKLKSEGITLSDGIYKLVPVS